MLSYWVIIIKKHTHTHTHTQNGNVLCRFSLSDTYLTINSFYSHLGNLNSLSRSRPSRLTSSLSLAVSQAWVAPRSNSSSPRQTMVSHQPLSFGFNGNRVREIVFDCLWLCVWVWLCEFLTCCCSMFSREVS